MRLPSAACSDNAPGRHCKAYRMTYVAGTWRTSTWMLVFFPTEKATPSGYLTGSAFLPHPYLERRETVFLGHDKAKPHINMSSSLQRGSCRQCQTGTSFAGV